MINGDYLDVDSLPNVDDEGCIGLFVFFSDNIAELVATYRIILGQTRVQDRASLGGGR